MVVQLLSGADRARAEAFVTAQGLAFEAGADDLVGAFEGGSLVACGARAGDVLKMIAIDPASQGGHLLGEVVGELTRLGLAAGHQGLFVFTRPEHAVSFEALNFRLLATQARVALLEHGGRFEAWVERCRARVREAGGTIDRAAGGGAAPRAAGSDTAGAVVLNANPFTRGHQWLVEQAAARVEALHLLVVREDRSAFPFEVRRRLVEEGTRHLGNVVVLDTGPYAVSALTFPAYFLGKGEPVAEYQLELDLDLFGRRVGPALGVRRRFFGSEPGCATTRAYNAAMHRLLPRHGIEPVELARLEVGGAPISASTVRAAMARDDLSTLRDLVPPSTLAYLLSPEGRALGARLATSQGRHG